MKCLKGYVVGSGYMGYVPNDGTYLLFCTEGEYEEYMGDDEDEE